MSPLEVLAVLLGVGMLVLILLALSRREFDSERPKYEMLGQEPPAQVPARPVGRLGPEDRIVRLGLVGAAFYYAARLDWMSVVGIVLSLVGIYLLMTGLLGRDPIYRLLKRPRMPSPED